jgi:vibriolysin
MAADTNRKTNCKRAKENAFMKRLLTASLLLAATVAFAKSDVPQSKSNIKDQDHNGVPTFVTGDLGSLNSPGNSFAAMSKAGRDKAVKDFMKAQKDLLKLAGTEDFEVRSTLTDGVNGGMTHTKVQETLNGMPIVGAEYIVHSNAAGNVVAMNGRVAVDNSLPRFAKIDGITATEKAARQNGVTNGRFTDRPVLTYVVNEKGNAFLAWAAHVEYMTAGGPQRDLIYADAITGDFVLNAPEYKYLKNRITYTANNGTTLPGTQKRAEGSADIGDAAIDAAHNYAGNVYDYYKNVHARDSYDNAGATIKSSAHYSTSYNNAFWNGTQMVYGDGDGTTFIALSRALDVDAHELTHAVTERTAGLTYSNESGALNEATSDILGNSCEAYTKNGGTPNANTWLVGEDIYTPGTAGDALRTMNDPAKMGDSDWYPTRYTGTSDNGGVHTNSGIANLAYYLMVMGGTHPRAKSTVNVPAFSATSSTSLDMAQRIWYRALTVYFTSSTNFQAARNATAQAAADLYGGTAGAAYNTVQKAWDAVGAPGGTTTPPGGTITLSNNQTVTGIAGATGSWTYYKITVPSGQSSLKVTMSGGTGDADLYVKFGAQPSSTVYDYRPYLSGNAESVSVTNPSAGDWYIGINGYAAYTGVSLNAVYAGTAPPPTCTNYTGTLSGTGANAYAPTTSGYVSSVSGTHSGKLTGPASGADFDLYLQKLSGTTWTQVGASESATANETINYSGTSGTYRWRVYSYSGSGSFTLCISHP